jgi:hypothetical protein
VEQVAWKGEPLRVTATRRVGSDWRRPFTAAGRKAVEALLLPPVAKYGFDRLWLETFARKDTERAAALHVAQKRKEAEWWSMVGDLAAMLREGVLEFRPWKDAEGRRAMTVPVLTSHTSHLSWKEVAAEAVLDGERVGWMTRDGDLVPPLGILD